jgi:saccharopine dehydrogenase-like NADP-dependent oxidoreductase
MIVDGSMGASKEAGVAVPEIAVIGCGAMGMAVALSLATGREIRLRVIDREADRLGEVMKWISHHAPRADVVAQVIDIESDGGQAQLSEACKGASAIGLVLPWVPTRLAIEALVGPGVNIASITRPNYSELGRLEEVSISAGCCLLLPMGLEPGLTEIFGVESATRVDRLETLKIRCGGLPATPVPPLYHALLFGAQISVTPRPAYAVECGQLKSLYRFDGLEELDVDGIGVLEAHHDGMLPWLSSDPALRGAAEINQKTLRWPGYTAVIRQLLELGLLNEGPISVPGGKVSPRQVVENVLTERIRRGSGDEDITVLVVEAQGKDEHDLPIKVKLQCVDRSDPTTRLSSMARVTGFTLAAALQMMADGSVKGRGVARPHEVFRGSLAQSLISSLGAQGLKISRSIIR